MKEPDSFERHWPKILPKVRDCWPRLTDDDVAAVQGNLDVLVERIRDRYGWTRSEAMNELTQLTMLARDAGVEKEGGRPKMSEAADLDHPPR